MNDLSPNLRPTTGLLGREEAIVDRLRAFLAEHAESRVKTEERFGAEVAGAEKAYARARAHADEEFARRLAKAEQQLAEAVSALEAQVAEREAQLRGAAETKRSGQMDRSEQRAERIEKTLRESAWLAETVLESARPKPGQQFEALCKHLESGLKRVAEAEAFVGGLWLTQGASAGKVDPAGADGEEVGAFDAVSEQAVLQAERLDRMRLPAMFRSGLAGVLVVGLVGGAAG